jgi:hypothetical protein
MKRDERRPRRLDGRAQAIDDRVGRLERDARLGIRERRLLAHSQTARVSLTGRR